MKRALWWEVYGPRCPCQWEVLFYQGINVKEQYTNLVVRYFVRLSAYCMRIYSDSKVVISFKDKI